MLGWLLRQVWGKDTRRADWRGGHCRCGGEWRYYDIGFDDGFQCLRCRRIVEVHEYVRFAKEDDP